MLREHFAAMQRVCFDRAPTDADFESLGSKSAWLIYRSMVRKRLVDVVETALPRTKAAIGESPFEELVSAWLAQDATSTRYFRHVPSEFVLFALPLLKNAHPEWVSDLMRYEICGWEVKHGISQHKSVEEFAFDKYPVMNPALRILRAGFAVHQKPTPKDGYESQATQLCIYRDSKHDAITWTLNPIAADLVEAWIPGDQTITECVQAITQKRGVAIDKHFLEKLSALLADFLEKGILLGGSSASR